MSEQLLTTGEISKYCNVTDRAVLKWIDKGKIKSYRTPGRHSRVSVEDFMRFLREYDMPVPAELEKKASGKKKVLVIEDDKGIAKTIENILTTGGLEVKVAYNGFAAGLMINEFKPDMITLDLLMPVVNGFEVCQRVRDNGMYDEMKILVISGVEDKKAKRKIIKLGADAFIVKPISSKKLLAETERLIGAFKK